MFKFSLNGCMKIYHFNLSKWFQAKCFELNKYWQQVLDTQFVCVSKRFDDKAFHHFDPRPKWSQRIPSTGYDKRLPAISLGQKNKQERRSTEKEDKKKRHDSIINSWIGGEMY